MEFNFILCLETLPSPHSSNLAVWYFRLLPYGLFIFSGVGGQSCSGVNISLPFLSTATFPLSTSVKTFFFQAFLCKSQKWATAQWNPSYRLLEGISAERSCSYQCAILNKCIYFRVTQRSNQCLCYFLPLVFFCFYLLVTSH